MAEALPRHSEPSGWRASAARAVAGKGRGRLMRIAIFGTGGVGGYFGGLLAHSGHEVTFIARGEHLRAIRAAGLKVKSVNGDFSVHPARAPDAPADIGPMAYVVVAVKQYDLREAASQIRPLIG